MSLRLINLDITSKCNLACQHCGAPDKKGEEELDLNSVLNLLEQMVKMNCYELIIAGGEPFCRPDILDILVKASESRIHTAILTNGTMIDEKIASNLGELPYLTYVRISMEYTGEELDTYRGRPGVFKDIQQGIQYLKQNGITVGLNTTIDKRNISQVGDILDFALEQKVNFIRFAPIELVGKSRDREIDESFYIDALIRILRLMGERSDYLNHELAQLPSNQDQLIKRFLTGCPASTISCSIGCNGDANPCPFIQANSGLNIRDNALEDIWMKLQQRRNAYSSEPKMGVCADCASHASCSGGCMATKTSRNLKTFEEQPICYNRVLEAVLSKVYTDPKVRKVLSGILYRQIIFTNHNIAPCHRSLPFWLYPLKVEAI